MKVRRMNGILPALLLLAYCISLLLSPANLANNSELTKENGEKVFQGKTVRVNLYKVYCFTESTNLRV